MLNLIEDNKAEAKMKIHILGICGTFMGGIAVLAKQLGHDVKGCDENVYPPMSTQLEQQGIELVQGFDVEQLSYKPDLVIVGNAMKRGNPAVEYLLNNNLPYTSGAAWLSENVLRGRHVLAVAGTHGKTSTSSVLAWILDYAGLEPGYMIGGVPGNFSVSSRLGKSPYFVIEADEYDTAFFDKRSKFVHYHPRTVILNNLEFDHADIFPDLVAIQTQFHHLIRIVPSEGTVIWPTADKNLAAVLEMGCWSHQQQLSQANWSAKAIKNDHSAFELYNGGQLQATIHWSLIGEHNQNNALAAFVAAQSIGIEAEVIAKALQQFVSTKRRLQVLLETDKISLYDDFAHHPTAIATTLDALRKKAGDKKIIAIIDLGSYTMRSGVHRDKLLASIKDADQVYFYQQDQSWQLSGTSETPYQIVDKVDDILNVIEQELTTGCQLVVMSNRGFEGIQAKLLTMLG